MKNKLLKVNNQRNFLLINIDQGDEGELFESEEAACKGIDKALDEGYAASNDSLHLYTVFDGQIREICFQRTKTKIIFGSPDKVK